MKPDQVSVLRDIVEDIDAELLELLPGGSVERASDLEQVETRDPVLGGACRRGSCLGAGLFCGKSSSTETDRVGGCL